MKTVMRDYRFHTLLNLKDVETKALKRTGWEIHLENDEYTAYFSRRHSFVEVVSTKRLHQEEMSRLEFYYSTLGVEVLQFSIFNLVEEDNV